jgi:ATP-binding cassette subfamily F protein uup
MARAPLLQLSDISLTFGGDPVFDDLDLVVQPGDRVALVGRNGSGKSTLMKVMAGLVEPDRAAGHAPGVSRRLHGAGPGFRRFATLGDFAQKALGPSEAWRVEMAAEGLKLRSMRIRRGLGRGAAARGAGAAAGRGARPDAAGRADQPPRYRGHRLAEAELARPARLCPDQP